MATEPASSSRPSFHQAMGQLLRMALTSGSPGQDCNTDGQVLGSSASSLRNYSVCVYVCVCVCVCVCVYMFVFVCVYECLCMCMCVCMRMCVCVCMHMCVYVEGGRVPLCVYLCVCVCVRERQRQRILCSPHQFFVDDKHFCCNFNLNPVQSPMLLLLILC